MAIKLEDITSSSELRHLDQDELAGLADELRSLIISTVSANGGHLASNLGTVELTLALLHNFDAYEDRVVWDVGHQSYSWKILTGRLAEFSTLRQEGGLSGFPKREESRADAFNTGHSSTSISAALGISRGMKLSGRRGRAIAVIGDGALTGGLAYEALNNVDQMKDDLIIIINDNQMSIDRNVGLLARHLARIRVSSRYLNVKSKVEEVLSRIPLFGKPVSGFLSWSKALIRHIAKADQGFFESLGFRYYGPVDGHDLGQLDRHLQAARRQHQPVVIHIVTQKGKGYTPAENTPSLYHGVSPFSVETGVKAASGNPVMSSNLLAGCRSFTDAFGRSITLLGQMDPSIVTITAAMTSGTGLTEFARRFPDRFYDVGIAEQHAVTMACGLAAGGVKPVVAVYSSFLQRALDQVLHDAVLQKLHIVICVDRAGIVGDDGETHQGLYDVSFLNALPGITILEPSDYRSLYDMLSFALYQCKGPVVIRYPRGTGAVSLGRSQLRVPLPSPEILHTGSDVTIAALGSLSSAALEAAVRLGEEGIGCEVIDVRCLKPLRTDMILNSARVSGCLITMEETVVTGGLAQNLALEIAQRGESILLRPHAVGDYPILQARQASARSKQGLDTESLMEEVRSLVLSRRTAVE